MVACNTGIVRFVAVLPLLLAYPFYCVPATKLLCHKNIAELRIGVSPQLGEFSWRKHVVDVTNVKLGILMRRGCRQYYAALPLLQKGVIPVR